MSRLGAKKGAYHSQLVQATATEPLPVIFTGPVMQSKNDKYVGVIYFKLAGEENEHYYSIENEQVKALLQQAPQGQVLWMTVDGNGLDPSTHTMQLMTQQGLPLGGGHLPPVANTPPPPVQQQPPALQPPAQQRPVPPQAQPAAPQPQRAAAPAQQMPFPDSRPVSFFGQYLEAMQAASEILDITMRACPEISDVSVDVLFTATKEIATTLFIEWNKSAGTRPLRGES